jgi:hypothetical protein
MDAYPLLARIAALLERHGLQVVLIGNAAAALQGAPVTTIDFDFLFRPTPSNKKKLNRITADLEAVLLKPHYPVSSLIRISRDEDGLQLDFMGEIDGITSFEVPRGRATEVNFGDATLLVATLADVILSKKAAGRPRDLAVLPVLEKCLAEPPLTKLRPTRKARLAALKKEDDFAERALIRRLLALPPEKRTHFLRKRIGFRMSCL